MSRSDLEVAAGLAGSKLVDLDSGGLEAEVRGRCPGGVWLSLLCQRGVKEMSL